jgi:hypothetical protein
MKNARLLAVIFCSLANTKVNFLITPFSRDPVFAKVANSIHKMQLRCFCNLDCLWHPSNRTPVNEKCTAYSRDFLFTRKHESKLSVFS